MGDKEKENNGATPIQEVHEAPNEQSESNSMAANSTDTTQTMQGREGLSIPEAVSETESINSDSSNSVSRATASERISRPVMIDNGPKDDKGNPLSYADLYRMMNTGHEPETKEQREAREKRERRNRLFSGISDTFSALSNLWFTHKLAPNMYNPRESWGTKTRDRYDRLKKERENNERDYNNGLLNAYKLDEARGRWKSEMAERRYQADLANQRADEKAKLDEALSKGKIDAAQYEAGIKKLELMNTPIRLAQENEKRDSEIGRNNAASYASYQSSNKDVHHFRGKWYKGNTKDYDKDVVAAAGELNERHKDDEGYTPIEVYQTIQTKDGSKKVRRSSADIAADIERQDKKDSVTPKKKASPTGGAGKKSPTA